MTTGGIVYIRDFENKDVCSQFTESWRQLRRHTGELLAMTTRKTELERFRTFLRECVENEWIAKLIFYTMSAEVVHSRLVAVLKTA